MDLNLDDIAALALDTVQKIMDSSKTTEVKLTLIKQASEVFTEIQRAIYRASDKLYRIKERY